MNVLPLRLATDVPAVGGKAANLAALIAAGAPVPQGFVLTNSALQRFVAEQEGLPPHVRADLLAAWRALRPPAIVRSSAVGEDSADASFAGQLDSIPNVTTAEDLEAAVLRVWESQWSPRVLAYQTARRTFLTGMGIVVQEQVDAVLSGVLFTVSPTSCQEMLLEYCEGLGEALVSGAVNPARISIARRDLAWSRLAGLAPRETGPHGRELTHEEVSALARLGVTIERTFGAPQDIEWAIDRAGALWIVQARPITTASQGVAAAAEEVLWSNANVNENFPQPISPLLYSVARAGYYHYFRNLGRAFGIAERRLAVMEPALRQIIGVHGARMYYNLSSIHDVLRSAPFGDLLAASFDQFVGVEAEEPEMSGGSGRKEPGRLYQAGELALIAAKTASQYAFLTRRVEQFERTADRFAAGTHPDRLREKSATQLADDLRGFMDIRCNRWKNASLADAGSMVCYGALQRLLAGTFPQEDQHSLHNTLLKALPDLVSSMPALKLWELSRMVRAQRPLRDLIDGSSSSEALAQIRTDPRFAEFREAFDTFLRDWGFRCSAELMLTAPSFQEDPTPVIDLLRSYAARDGESPADQLARQADERAQATRRVLGELRGRRIGRVPLLPAALVVGVVLRWTQRCIQLRERARLKQALLYSRLRRIALALGERLTRQNTLERADDIFFLTVDEIDLLVAGGEMFPHHVAPLVRLRRAAHAELSATTPPDSLRLARGEYLAATAAPGDNTEGPERRGTELRGVGACGGTTTAAAAILVDVTESDRLRTGDILVTRQTDPGWGPIFPLISGLVIERGGMLSHGAIIAREFGIPSVVGVKDATRLIPHGGSITVDGDRGTVRVVEAAR